MLPSDQRPPGQDYLMRRLADLERQVRELQAARRMESASIGSGGISIDDSGAVTVNGGRIVVYDTDGNQLALLGDLGGGYRGTWLGRAGGSVAVAAYGTGPDANSGFVGIYDRSGNYVVTDDAWSARGLARPYIPIQVGEITPPTSVTSSGTFADIYAGAAIIQHPVMYAYLLIRASDATTAGEIRITLDSAQIGPTLTVSAGAYTYAPIGPFRVGTVNEQVYGQIHTLTIQARRTAGTGTVGARVMSLLGLESAFVPS